MVNCCEVLLSISTYAPTTGWSHIKFAFTTKQAAVYEPLAWVAKGVQYTWMFGGANSVRGYVAVSLVAHTLAAVALFAIVLRLVRRCTFRRVETQPILKASGIRSQRFTLIYDELLSGFDFKSNLRPYSLAPRIEAGMLTEGVTERRRMVCSVLATLLFSLHPLRAEVVAWCSCQPYALMTAFLAAALLLHVRRSEGIEAAAAGGSGYKRSGTVDGLGLSSVLLSSVPIALLYLAAVMCKSAAVPAGAYTRSRLSST